MKIINRKIITISQNLATRQWSSNIFLNFQPDEMIVKYIVCNGTAGAPIANSALLFCPTINESLGAFYNNSCSISPNMVFDAKNYVINSSWNFQIRNVDGTINTTFDGHLIFTLEFLKFA